MRLIKLLTCLSLVSAVRSECRTYSVGGENDYELCWKVVGEKIEMNVSVITEGWIGFGLAEPNGGSMPGADIVTVEWIDEQPVVKDRFAVSKTTPEEDECEHSDWEIEGFIRDNGRVNGTITRFLTVPDKKRDRDIVPGETRIILAYGDVPHFGYHSHKRLATEAHLVPGGEALPLPEYEIEIDLRMDNVSIAGKRTNYICRSFDMAEYLPDILTGTEYHAVSFSALDDTPLGAAIHGYQYHHSFFHSCPGQNDVWDSFVDSHNQSEPDCMALLGGSCQAISYGWAVGANAVNLPPEAGFRYGDVTPGAHRWMILQMHYDNPIGAPAGPDTSGVRIRLTTTMRQHDAEVFDVGDPYVQVPTPLPSNEHVTIQVDCPSECTSSFTSDITVFSTMSHMHQMGTRMRMTHWRDGEFVDELSNIDYWDFNLQIVKPYTTTIRAGDSIHTQCHYYNTWPDTMYFGSGTDYEMCLGLLWVYPRTNVQYCGFWPGELSACNLETFPAPGTSDPTVLRDPVYPVVFGNAMGCVPSDQDDDHTPGKDVGLFVGGLATGGLIAAAAVFFYLKGKVVTSAASPAFVEIKEPVPDSVVTHQHGPNPMRPNDYGSAGGGAL
eukprot:TRINITY_DN13081_c0_g1_i1.p1 TRINITY_DN13081_c0_g1~~TRINITY_DN13081_c0_g1_i1.p1  ORF type:complete len:625 (+),score=97.67 TRINITY_DN13081_c0_g1_i1:54-1877(+)